MGGWAALTAGPVAVLELVRWGYLLIFITVIRDAPET